MYTLIAHITNALNTHTFYATLCYLVPQGVPCVILMPVAHLCISFFSQSDDCFLSTGQVVLNLNFDVLHFYQLTWPQGEYIQNCKIVEIDHLIGYTISRSILSDADKILYLVSCFITRELWKGTKGTLRRNCW